MYMKLPALYPSKPHTTWKPLRATILDFQCSLETPSQTQREPHEVSSPHNPVKLTNLL
jgi:hypothetical protein